MSRKAVRVEAIVVSAALVCLIFGQQASAGSHLTRISSYAGPATCAVCHGSGPVNGLFGSVHFKWRSTSPLARTPGGYGTDFPGGGSHGMLDRSCGLPGTTSMANNFAGIPTSPLNGTTRSEGCAACHVAYRPAPLYADAAAATPEIDCLICHAAVYGAEWDDPAIIAVYGSNGESHVRKVIPISNPTMLSFSQDRTLMTAKLVGEKVSVKACERCHKKNMSGYKRATPMSATTDVHTAKGMLCTACHITKSHKIARGNWVTDMMANDSPETDVNCASFSCHGPTPHSKTINAADLNRHTTNMRCEACHINTMDGTLRNVDRRAWGPSTWDPVMKRWDATPATANGLELPNFWDAYTSYYPSAGTSAGKPTVRWFNGISSFMAQPYGGYTDRVSRGGKAKLQAFKRIVGGMFFDAAYLPGPPQDGSFDLVNGTWPYSYKESMEHWWPYYLAYGLIDAKYPTPESYWLEQPEMAMLLNMYPKVLQFNRTIFQTEGGTKVGTPSEGVQSAATYPGIAKAIDAGMGGFAITLGAAPAGSDPIQVGAGLWSGSFFGMWKPVNMDPTSPFYGELGLFMTMSHAVKAGFGAAGTNEPCLKCHCDATSYANKTCNTSGKYVNFRMLGYPDIDGNAIYDRMYDIVAKASAPTFTPVPGTFNAPPTVQIHCATPDAVIRYTTDGITPIENTGLITINDGPVPISRTGTVLKAICVSPTSDPSDVTSGTYILKTANPVLTPGAGSSSAEQTVTFASATPAATICYTTDGTIPTRTNGTQVPTGSTLVIDRSLTVKAFAFRDAMLDSGLITAAYIFKASTPIFSLLGGTYLNPQSVVISTATAQARIRYTTDGSTPTDTVGTDVASGSTVVVDRSLTLKAIAYRDGWTPSVVVSATYTCKTTLPVLSQIGGTYGEAQFVTITSITPGASIRYTTDGVTWPTDTVGFLMANGGTLLVNRTLTLKAIAYRDGWTPTSVVSATYTLKTSTPTFSPFGATYLSPQWVTFSSATPGALFRYTTDGSTPSQNHGIIGSSLLVDRSLILKVVSFKWEWTDSNVVSGIFTLKATLPVLSVVGGAYAETQNVTITSPTLGASIRYTTDGVTLPTDTVGTDLANGGTVTVNRSLTLKAIAYRDGWTPTAVVSAGYTLKAATPTLSTPGGTYYTSQTVTIASITVGTIIGYTTDGSTPSQTNGSLMPSGGAVLVDRSLTLKAVAFRPGWTDTTIVSGIYTLRLTPPFITPPAGTYSAPLTVTVTTTSPATSIQYTTDGSTPSCDQYHILPIDGGLALNRSLVLKVIACRDGWTPSSVVSATYTFKAATPTLSPPGTTCYASQNVKLTSATPGTTISYTTDGSTPSQANGTQIPNDTTVPVDRSLTLKAVAFMPGWTNTTVASGTYTFRVMLPAFSQFGGTYNDTQNVVISTTTVGGRIRYTTDGTTPTDTVGTDVASGSAVVVDRSLTLKSVAYRPGWTPTTVVSATYTLRAATPTLSSPGTTYYTPQNVTITSTTTGTAISYTTDGSTPSQTNGNQIPNGTAVLVDRSLTLKAVSFRPGWTDTPVVSGTYTFRLTPPLLTPAGGTYSAPLSLVVTTTTPATVIKYTTDGTTPTCIQTNAMVMESGLVVDRSLVLKVIACRDGWVPSSVISLTYTLKAATPTFSLLGGTYLTAQDVVITSATTGASISYTTDGTTPSQTNGTVIPSGGTVLMDRSMVMKAVAFKPGWTDTIVVSATYTFRVTKPAVSPVGGAYLEPQSVTIASPTPGALIHYTTDGTTPTAVDGIDLENGGTVIVDRTLTLKAIAYKPSCVDSTALSESFTFKVVLPAFTPAPGTYSAPLNVTISTTTPGALIRYTTDGTTPRPDYGLTLANGSTVAISQYTYLRALAYRDGWASTYVLSGTYTIKPPL